jgi:predicted phosphodiesterase
MMKLAVLSDIHSAAGAYRAALDAARSEGFDMLVILGDLLTYGPFPERTLEITNEAAARHETMLIEGNHDEIYLASKAGAHAGGWIGESIDWTRERIDKRAFAGLEWRPEFVIGDLLFAHANPHGFGDWSYLRSEDDFRSAASALHERGLRHGVFGHSHRQASFESAGVRAMTVGSVGQPRSRTNRMPSWTMVTLDEDRVEVSVRDIDFDWRAHCASIRSTSLSDSTKDRLCEFFQ